MDFRQSATSRDVAKALDIAQSTVSRAFTPGASISPDLRRRILEVAEELGYRPNLLARGLIAGRSKLIAVVLARQTNLLYPELLYEVSGRLADKGYQVLLFPTDDDGAIATTIERVLAYRVDAVLSTGVIDESQALAITRNNLPLVMFNRHFDLPISSVACDFAVGARDLVMRLIQAGHRRLALISGPEGSYVGDQVIGGVHRAVAATAGAQVTVTHAAYAYDSGAAAIDRLFEVDAGVSAVICVNDTVAVGCLDHLRSETRSGGMGRRVPEDVSIVAFEASAPASWRGYQLTGMCQPVGEMTAAVVDILLAQIANPRRTAEQRLLRPRFVRGSTAVIG